MNRLFAEMCELNQLEVVKFLASLPDVDASVEGNEAIRWASFHGHLELVKFLASLPEVDASAWGNETYWWASHNGHVEVVKFLESLQK